MGLHLVAPAMFAADGRIVRVGFDPELRPFTYVDDKKVPSGFTIDLLREFGQRKGYNVQFQASTASTLKSEFGALRYDLVAGVPWRPANLAWTQLSAPYAKLPAEIFLRKGVAKVKRLEGLRALRLAVVPATRTHDFLIGQGFGASLVPGDTLRANLDALHQNRADAVIAASELGKALIQDLRFADVEPTGVLLDGLATELCVATQPEDRELLYDLNSFLLEARTNGYLAGLEARWLGVQAPVPSAWNGVKTYALVTLLILIPGVSLFYLQRRLLRKLRAQAEAVQRSEERFKLIVEGSEDAFWDWDVPSGRLERSDQWSRILGYSRDQLPPTLDAFRSLTHPDDIPRVEAAKQQILRDGHCRVEYRVRAIDGTWRWIYDRGKVVSRDERGRPIRLTGAATDVTLRKRIEHALVRSQALLEQTQEAAEMGGWDYDPRQRSFFWTKQLFRIHDLEHEEDNLPIDRVLSFYIPADQEVLRNAIEAASEQATPFDLELEIKTATGRTAWVRYIGRVERAGSSVTRIFGSVQEITQRHRAEDEREQLQSKMLEAQKLESLGVLAGGIAHDFNNILTVIMGSASLARDEPAMVSESLDHIQTAANRAADLCRQMLAYAGKSRFSLEVHDINGIVRDTVELLRLSVSKNAELEFALHPEAIAVEADSSQLRQVIMNLVINASDAITEGGGKIRVSSKPIQVTRAMLRDARIGQEASEGTYVALEVSDTGTGMSAETMNRIFDPFFTTKFTGRGLGLAAVLGIVRAHRGAFFVRSTLGKGSVFTMLLPVTQATPQPPPRPLPAKPATLPRQEGKILVVDDEPDVRKIAGAILEKQGYTVALASDGYEALALALAHGMQFKCVLLDLTMPGLDGPATFRELRALNRNVPILIMSGFSEADARKQLSVDGRVAFLAKPFASDDLIRRINAMPGPGEGSATPFV